MNCIKCGRETTAERLFCEDCLLEMEKYPVRPGTVVQLPVRKEAHAPKNAPKRKTVPLEDQVRTLKKRCRFLTIAFLLAAVLAAALVHPAISYLREDHFKTGQNYNSIVTAPSSEAAKTPK